MLQFRKIFLGIVVSALLVQLCPAQRNPPNTERDGADSWLIDRITLDSDPVRKLALLEKFVAEFPQHEGIGWAYEQIYGIAVETNQLDRVLSAGEKLLGYDADDIEIAQRNLDIAAARKDPALIEKWSQIAGAIAKRIIASPQPTDTGKRRLELARQMNTYEEYLAYTEVRQTAPHARKIELMEDFLRRNPHSLYTPLVQNLYLEAFREAGDSQRAVAVAKNILDRDSGNADALLTVAEEYFKKEKEPVTVLAYATKILAAMDRDPRPEGMEEAEWSRKKALFTGRANWMIGSISIQQGNFRQANKSIRAALPYLKGNDRLMSAALFYLGWANYQTGAIAEAIRFNQACALVNGPFQAQAAKNLAVIHAESPEQP